MWKNVILVLTEISISEWWGIYISLLIFPSSRWCSRSGGCCCSNCWRHCLHWLFPVFVSILFFSRSIWGRAGRYLRCWQFSRKEFQKIWPQCPPKHVKGNRNCPISNLNYWLDRLIVGPPVLQPCDVVDADWIHTGNEEKDQEDENGEGGDGCWHLCLN